MPSIFNITELISRTPEVLGTIDWLSSGLTADLRFVEGDQIHTLVDCLNEHNLKDGTTIYLAGAGFGIDGFYQVQAIEKNDGDDGSKHLYGFYVGLKIDRTYEGVTVHTIQSYPVHFVDKLSVKASAEFKRLREVDRFALQMRQAEAATKSQGAMELIDRLQIDMSTGEANEEALSSQIKENPTQFLSEVKSLDLGSLVDLQRVRAECETELKQIERRELEILCQMPVGQMSLMDNFPGISDEIDGIYEKVLDLTEAAALKKKEGTIVPESGEEDTEAPKSQKRSRKPKNNIEATSQESLILSPPSLDTDDAEASLMF